MEILERIWEILGVIFGGFAQSVERAITSIFGSSNARYIKRLMPKVEAINALEPKYQGMSDEELRGQTELFRKRLAEGETLDDLLVEAFAVCREAGRRYLNMRHYDVQLMGGIVLHSGGIAEMVTGEGKTLVSTLPAYLNALEGKGVHVVTVNDYLARRDMEWMGRLHMALGLTVGAIYADMDPTERQRAYNCDITYGTNNEFGFDYLRDNMKIAAKGDDRFPRHLQQCQRPLNFAIIDEVDNILIDEARTPLIISGPAHDDVTKYSRADKVARQLQRDVHFEVKEKEHTVHLTDEGVRAAEKLAGVESFYTAGNMEWPHLIDNSLKAHHLYKRDVNYVVQDGQVIIVDEFTGRLMHGRNWSDGLHQAVEAKENVKIKQESQTLATITLQNFFKLYNKLSGMTGTAMTEASEFWKIYQLDVVAMPTNRELQRINYPDVIYRTEHEKYEAIAHEVERIHKWDVVELKDGNEVLGQIQNQNDQEVEIIPQGSKARQKIQRSQIAHIQRSGRPVLIGTVSIEKSERISDLLNRRGIEHQVLNAKHHKREAEIVAQAGRNAAVTIATNMAGRGTDIILGGNAETMAWAILQEKYATRLEVPRSEWDALVDEIRVREHMKEQGREVAEKGGLHVIGTERHEARRIDNQLRGRSGRQGDPGSSRFYLSLEDDLMRIFAGEWVKNVLSRLGMQEGEAIESKMVSRRIEGAQKKVEERHFESRKHLLEYDEVMDEQRRRVYHYRNNILQGDHCKRLLMDMIREQVDHYLNTLLDKDYGTATFCAWVGQRLGVDGLEPREFRDMDFAAAERYAKDEACRQVEVQILDAMEIHLNDDADPSEWNWEAMAKLVNLRWQLSVNDRALKKVGRDELPEFLITKSQEAVEAVDCSEGAAFLDPDYGVRSACNWVNHKFGIELPVEEMKQLDPEEFRANVLREAENLYNEKEVEYPVMAGIYHFSRGTGEQRRVDRDSLAKWAKDRFRVDLNLDELSGLGGDEYHSQMLAASRKNQERAEAALAEVDKRMNKLFGEHRNPAQRVSEVANKHALEDLTAWLDESTSSDYSVDELGQMYPDELHRALINAVEDHYRPEIRRMERQLVLHLLDAAWKEHLLSMDHLRSSVGLVGYAQVDPKVEYKREGMRIFEIMWKSIGEQATDLLFRMESLDEGFVGSTWAHGVARHDEAPSTMEMASEAEANVASSSSGEVKPEPIRNRQDRVGRNDPCPCNSGKKFKNCCMKKKGAA